MFTLPCLTHNTNKFIYLLLYLFFHVIMYNNNNQNNQDATICWPSNSESTWKYFFVEQNDILLESNSSRLNIIIIIAMKMFNGNQISSVNRLNQNTIDMTSFEAPTSIKRYCFYRPFCSVRLNFFHFKVSKL